MIWKLWNIHKEIAKSLWNNEFNDDSIMDIINDSYNIMFFSITKFCFFKDCKTTWIEKYFYTWINFNV